MVRDGLDLSKPLHQHHRNIISSPRASGLTHTQWLQDCKMTKATRGDIAWWFDATLVEDQCTNVTSRGADSELGPATGFRLARTQQVLENTEGTECER